MTAPLGYQSRCTMTAPRRWALFSPGRRYKRAWTRLARGVFSPPVPMPTISPDDAATLHSIGVHAIQSFVALFIEAVFYSAFTRVYSSPLTG